MILILARRHLFLESSEPPPQRLDPCLRLLARRTHFQGLAPHLRDPGFLSPSWAVSVSRKSTCSRDSTDAFRLLLRLRPPDTELAQPGVRACKLSSDSCRVRCNSRRRTSSASRSRTLSAMAASLADRASFSPSTSPETWLSSWSMVSRSGGSGRHPGPRAATPAPVAPW